MEVDLYSHIIFPSMHMAKFAEIMMTGDATAPLFEAEVTDDDLKDVFKALEVLPISEDVELTDTDSIAVRVIARWNFDYSELEEAFSCLKKLLNCPSCHYIVIDEGYEGAASIIGGKYVLYETWDGKAVSEWEFAPLLDSMEIKLVSPTV